MTDRAPSTYKGAPARDIGNPQPLKAKLRLVRNGPYVAAEIRRNSGGWFALIDGRVAAHVLDNPADCPEIMRIWTFARDCTPQEWRALTRAGRDVDAREPVNLNEKGSLF